MEQNLKDHLTEPLSIWLGEIAAAFTSGDLIKISLTKPSGVAGDLKSIDVRPILIKRVMCLSFTSHHKTRDIVKNYDLTDSQKLLAELLATQFSQGRLFGVNEDVGLARQGSRFVLVRGKATLTKPADMSHNRAKNHPVKSSGKAYLHALGLTDDQGAILKTAQDKFRQINKYIEIVDGLLKSLPQSETLRIVDMGAGKGYLTFALYDHVANTVGRAVEIIGVEARPDLVTLCNDIARDAGFVGLKFVEGTIASFDCAGVDVVIALHACDTATDDAIAKAVLAKAQLIVVAPCCHKQIRRDMRQVAAPDDLTFLLRFGTYQERMAEMLTDGMRAQLMELSGYDCKLFEFIADAHTPKNVMIVGQRRSSAMSAERMVEMAAGLAAAKAKFGIPRHYLETALARN
jgi:Methyltransferase domain